MPSVLVSLDLDSRVLVVQTETVDKDRQIHADALQFPFVWLRDNCQCDKCFHPVSKARLFLLRNLDPNITPNEAQVTDTGNIEVTWPDDHRSVFALDWLKKRRFLKEGDNGRQMAIARTTKLWNADLQNKIPRFDYTQLMNSNASLLEWLVEMEELGLTLITGAPTKAGVLKTIGEKVAFLKPTNYGEAFTVRSKLDPSNVAYTAITLGLHTDLPQYIYTPGVQMLHCIAQTPTAGGDNVFTDGFYTAEILRKYHPHHFQTLTTTKVGFQDIGTDAYQFNMLTSVPTIQLDSSGKPSKINFNNQIRDSFLSVPLNEVQPFYDAMSQFEELLNAKSNCVGLKLKEGEIVCFHNYRVLHGRNGYHALERGERHLEGGYLDWDEMRSRRRVLEGELGKGEM